MNSSPHRWLLILFACVLGLCAPSRAQLPFYTDDTGVTEAGKWHFEFFNEYDALQLQFPNVRQNTANFKWNRGFQHNLELDVDVPYLSIDRAAGSQPSSGFGDTELGIKWAFHQKAKGSLIPALATSLYIEFPTGDTSKQLGSGLTDYWLNLAAQQPLSETTRVTTNIGILFAGNTSTGVLGIESSRGQVYTGGLSLLHDFTRKLTLGGEVYGGYAENDNLGRSQLQAMAGGQFQIRDGLALCFGLLGGKYVASPQIGGQIGFSMDFPALWSPKSGRGDLQ